ARVLGRGRVAPGRPALGKEAVMSVALLRVASRSVVVSVLAVGLWLGAAGWVRADLLNPFDFTSLGAFPHRR
ncbi:MAG: hypothetical protein ACXVBO_22590, partial [Isosphaeraceae bacterium]